MTVANWRAQVVAEDRQAGREKGGERDNRECQVPIPIHLIVTLGPDAARPKDLLFSFPEFLLAAKDTKKRL